MKKLIAIVVLFIFGSVGGVYADGHLHTLPDGNYSRSDGEYYNRMPDGSYAGSNGSYYHRMPDGSYAGSNGSYYHRMPE